MRKIPSPFCVNDWDIKAALTAILSLQFVLWGVIELDVVGFHIPIIRELVASIYLLFVPGILVLRILNVHRLNSIESLIYTIGVSIALVMFSALFLNSAFLAYGLSRPLSLIPLLTMISALVLVLCAAAYIKDRGFCNPRFIDVASLRAPPALCLCLVPFLSIFGTYAFNFYNVNSLLVFLLLIIGFIVILIGFGRLIPTHLYPLAIFAISLSLLFHTSLISKQLWGWDIQLEASLVDSAIQSGFWNSGLSLLYNSALGIGTFSPSFSIISGMDSTWVFKIVYPLLFSLVPLGLFRVYQKQTNDRIAALSAFFFVSLYFFYTELVQVARQEVAELFVVMFILLMISNGLNRKAKPVLLILSLFSIAVAHYATSYLLMIVLVSAWIILYLGDRAVVQKTVPRFFSRFSATEEEHLGRQKSTRNEPTGVSGAVVLLFIIFALAWYLYTAGSAPVIGLLSLGTHIASSLGEFFSPQATQGAYYALTGTGATSLLHDVARYVDIASLFFVAVGIIALLLKETQMKFAKIYRAFAVASAGVLVASIITPYLASALNTTRLLHFSLIVLAPFAVIGAITSVRALDGLFGASRKKTHFARHAPALFAVFLVILFLFNNGLIYETAKDNPQSIALTKGLDYPMFNEKEFVSAQWLVAARTASPTMGNYLPVYADANHYELFERFGLISGQWTLDNTMAPGTSYVFLGSYNLAHGTIDTAYTQQAITYGATSPLGNLVNNRSKIFDDGGAKVYT